MGDPQANYLMVSSAQRLNDVSVLSWEVLVQKKFIA